MNAGTSRRANAAHSGSSSGSSTFRREPSGLVVRSPNCLPTSPTPSAPALMSASSCFARLLRPTGSDVAEVDAGEDAEAILVRRRVERLPACCVSRSPRDVLGDQHDLQVQRVHHPTTTRSIESAVLTSPGWPCTSMVGNFAFGTLCSAVTSVLLRAVVENARRRLRRRLAIAGPHFGRARRAFLAGRDACAAAALRAHGPATDDATESDCER